MRPALIRAMMRVMKIEQHRIAGQPDEQCVEIEVEREVGRVIEMRRVRLRR